MSVELKDEILVSRAKEDDQRAVEELIRRYQQKAYSIAYRMCGDAEEARDLTQEVFLRVFRELNTFKGKSSFYTWFYRILINACLDERRRRQRWKRIFFPWKREQSGTEDSDEAFDNYPDMKESSDPDAMLDRSQLTEKVQKTLMNLPDRQRMVFQLKVFEEMSIPEIAGVMNLAEGTVKSHLFRATCFLRNALKEWVKK
ncbi:MAG: hypothetical protein BWK80_20820 [Desulfobacteraceae bacterium IS3]|nr:MAG: hypothetical protein BWK80_20820 [Desulfobacteraceae bacterium IS3]